MHRGLRFLFFFSAQMTFAFSRALQQSVDPITFRWDLMRLILSKMSELTSLTCLFLSGIWPHALSCQLTAHPSENALCFLLPFSLTHWHLTYGTCSRRLSACCLAANAHNSSMVQTAWRLPLQVKQGASAEPDSEESSPLSKRVLTVTHAYTTTLSTSTENVQL